MASQYQVTCIHSFEAAQEEWLKFESTAEHYLFQSYSWQRNWFNQVGSGNVSPRIIIVSDHSNNTLMLLPLCIQKKHLLQELTFMGGLVTDYHAPMISASWHPTNNETKLIWQQIKLAISNVDLICFEKQPDSINAITNPLKILFQNEMALSHALTLDAPWEQLYLGKVSKRIRADSRRQIKRLTDIGELHFEIGVSTERAPLIIDKMIAQKRSRYKNMGVYDLFDEPGYQRFFTNMHEQWQALGQVHISALSIDDEIIATHWGVVDSNRFYYLMPSYEAGDWARFSAGRLLLEEMIKWSIENKLDVFDFSFGDEAYKKNWCDTSMSLFLTMQATSVLGRGYCLLWSLKEKIKSVKALKKLVTKLKKN